MIEILIPANTAQSSRRRTFSRLGALAALVLPLSLLTQGIAVAARTTRSCAGGLWHSQYLYGRWFAYLCSIIRFRVARGPA